VNRLRLALAFGGMILLGLGAAATGVLIPYQMADYHVDKVVVGLLFFAFSAGYLLSGVANGPLIHRLGTRGHLSLGAGVYLATAFGIGLHPGFVPLLAATVALGFGAGILDAGLNAYVAALPRHIGKLNLLHGFYGVGALLGPVIAAELVHRHLPWQDTFLVLAVAAAPVFVGYLLVLPVRTPPAPDEVGGGTHLSLALRHPAVWLAALFLFLYVGIEVTVGNWGFTLLTQGRGEGDLLAGYVVSGYWLGLTTGRFLISPATSRVGIGPVAMVYGCLLAVVLSVVLAWWGPGALVAALGFALLGFFLGPMFPTTIAVTPQLMPVRLVPAAIGLLIGASVVGGSVFPFVAGALAQGLGLGALLPFLFVLALVQTGGWWAIARRVREPVPQPSVR
jgi:fucose permease